jgi:AAA+ ATPase superfamily predicted ATPase
MEAVVTGPVLKPDYIFGRDAEWQALADFATDTRLGATLGVVSGRRRQGKTLLLESMCEELDGLYFTVPEDMPAGEHLRRLAEAIAAHSRTLPPRLETWDQAIEALFRLGADKPVLVVLDEFSYMANSAKGLPSIIQHALSPRGAARTQSRTRLVLCGSALSFMTGLVAGSAALYGRARFSLTVHAFDFRTAATFWGVEHDLRLAAALYAMTGGTPAYIEYVSETPANLADLRTWVPRNLLNSTNMLFRQPRMLLSEDPSFNQIGMYGAVLTAIAEGSRTASSIANRLGRTAADIQHYLKGLTDGGFLRHCPDAFRANRAEYQITDALIRFHHAIVYPNWSRLELYRPERVMQFWAEAQQTFSSQVMGPSFEHMGRTWTEQFADAATLGGSPARVTYGVLNDPAGKSQCELDVVASESDGTVLAIGEAKSGEIIDHKHLARLQRASELLRTRGSLALDAQPVLLLFGGAGFTPELIASAASTDGMIQLIDLERLYAGSLST